MKKIKLIRIDETPRKFSQNSLKILMDPSAGLYPFGRQNHPSKPSFSSLHLPFSRDQERRGQSFLPGHGQHMQPGGEPSEGIELPPHIIDQLIKTNDLIVSLNAELEQRKIARSHIQEYQHDSFKIGLKVTEGIFFQNMQPLLAGRQFDLAVIHIENTIITLENFEYERIGSSYKVDALKKACVDLIPFIKELKEYFELD
ncbi:hypothetical protein KJ705_01615 [Patescibacteria group bacterium]|nr:hypothetical protein [Patescibacteria group bacterium]